MTISPEQLERFVELYSKEYGVVLDEERAIKEFTKLAQLYKIVYLKKA